MADTPVIPVILSGGSGTRLWPLSRQDRPKQFLSLFNDETLFQNTVRRVMRVCDVPAESVITVTLPAMRAETQAQLQSTHPGLTRNIVIEPCARNTAAAIALALCHIRRSVARDAVIIVFPSDHFIADENAMMLAIQRGITAARSGHAATFGILPTHAETGYGYIALGEKMDHAVYRVNHFHEKPQIELARQFHQSGHHLWSSGIHAVDSTTLINLYQRHAPDTLRAAMDYADNGNAAPYESLLSQPYEIAIAENCADMVVVRSDMGWSDVGSWANLWSVRDKDIHGNVTNHDSIGRVVAVDTRDSIIHAGDRMIACIGLRDVVVVDHGDCILVSHKDATDQLKTTVATLQKMNMPQASRSVTHKRDDHSSIVLSEDDTTRLRAVSLTPGTRIEGESTGAEQWIISNGSGTVVMNGRTIIAQAQDCISLPPRTAYTLINTGLSEMSIFEFRFAPCPKNADEIVA